MLSDTNHSWRPVCDSLKGEYGEGSKDLKPEELYEELDFRLALTHGHLEKVKKLPAKGFGRKGMHDYLATAHDLFKLLDSNYWVTKNSFLPTEHELAVQYEENREVVVGLFEDVPY